MCGFFVAGFWVGVGVAVVGGGGVGVVSISRSPCVRLFVFVSFVRVFKFYKVLFFQRIDIYYDYCIPWSQRRC